MVLSETETLGVTETLQCVWTLFQNHTTRISFQISLWKLLLRDCKGILRMCSPWLTQGRKNNQSSELIVNTRHYLSSFVNLSLKSNSSPCQNGTTRSSRSV